MIIGFTGPARAGKDVASRYISDKFGFKILSFSDVLENGQKIYFRSGGQF